MASTCATMSPATAPYAEWCVIMSFPRPSVFRPPIMSLACDDVFLGRVTATGITLFVYLSAPTEHWLAAVCIGIACANWLSLVPGLAVVLLNVRHAPATRFFRCLLNKAFFVGADHVVLPQQPRHEPRAGPIGDGSFICPKQGRSRGHQDSSSRCGRSPPRRGTAAQPHPIVPSNVKVTDELFW